MKRFLNIILLFGMLIFIPDVLHSQAEDVAVTNPVYSFLKRMELKRIIPGFRDAVLPLSRKEIAALLQKIEFQKESLTDVEQKILSDFGVEFQFDLSGSVSKSFSIFDNHGEDQDLIRGLSGNNEKYLYVYSDSNLNMFVNGLLTVDGRRTKGDILDNSHAEYVQFGGRIRGTVYNRLGYYLQVTNAQFWGSRDVLKRDKYISQAYTLGILDAQNFDIVEGYARYDAGIVSAQVGRERLLWGQGYGDKLIVSDNTRLFDFIRINAEYKSFRYTFLHGWLLGKKSQQPVVIGGDVFTEPVVADKYIGAHRFEFFFPSLFTLGFQEIAIYSNRSPDLAYLNPVNFIESVQRSREERDNVLWAFDIKTSLLKNTELQASVLLDDINFPKWGTSDWQNKYTAQIGASVVDPFGIPNITTSAEYTRVQPFMYSHNRSRDNDYGSLGQILSHHIGPNSDSWFFKFDWYPHHKVSASVQFELQREGENIYDSTGNLIKNVGGDFLSPHRDSDPQNVTFLDGARVDTYSGKAMLTYEIVNEIFVDVRYQFHRRKEITNDAIFDYHEFGTALRFDF